MARQPHQHEHFDVVIVGGGHNGLVAAAYLAKAGRSVLVLERQDHLGGAAVSQEVFPGTGALLSRYSYLVSLFPRQIIQDLGLDLQLIRRRYSSYTPVPDTDRGLLVDNQDGQATRESFESIGVAADFSAFGDFYRRTGELARTLWPTATQPLRRRNEMRQLVADNQLWSDIFERPIGEVLERTFTSDLVRGTVLTDALISTFAGAHDANLQQNKCFLYHVIGGGTGDWDVPRGGMGAVSGALEQAARAAGAQFRTSCEVTSVSPEAAVTYDGGGQTGVVVSGNFVLANVAPAVLHRLLGEEPDTPVPVPEGAQAKVNLLLARLPKLLDPQLAPEAAFGGTFHINELYSQLETAHAEAAAGNVPNPLPAEIYCHTLSDPSILPEQLGASGAHTLTVFTLQTPHRLLTAGNNSRMRQQLQDAVRASLNSVLAEPIEDCLLRDADGRLCIETKTTMDLEATLNMPGGNIFHGPLSWPFAEDDDPLDTPARRWGVGTAHSRILLCGAGARRGGGVSGLGGHNAAMAVLEEG
ncbi:phytoene desaturase family protein [Arthrobacter sp. VKM Ac-2550]|uniref:phytoene desaturase family protein n=1 Tax=Crystallibacter permensis TaxID=1938888 RepID=UPI002225F4ED|nr:NAD(P)/FAD-dependent oxidoreductase [Arthrobacter sp. VKM Ac-2550]MCW2133820.1 Phytoene dehydrogenase-related protein [Arthrobacter sp. VKM Ac-2550]